MVIKDDEFIDIETPTGPMRTYIFHPVAEGLYPHVLLFSETIPRRRASVTAWCWSY